MAFKLSDEKDKLYNTQTKTLMCLCYCITKKYDII